VPAVEIEASVIDQLRGIFRQPGQRLLPAAPDLGCRSRADAPDRRIASGLSLCREPDADGTVESRRP
jgi:hypothetical protein